MQYMPANKSIKQTCEHNAERKNNLLALQTITPNFKSVIYQVIEIWIHYDLFKQKTNNYYTLFTSHKHTPNQLEESSEKSARKNGAYNANGW